MASTSTQKMKEPRPIRDLLCSDPLVMELSALPMDTDLKEMMEIRSPNFQLVPFKAYGFGQQRYPSYKRTTTLIKNNFGLINIQANK